MTVSKEVYRDIREVLAKHKIPYTTSFETTNIPRASDHKDVYVHHLHVQINFIVPDYFDDISELKE